MSVSHIPAVVELNLTEMARAADCAHKRNQMDLTPDGDDGFKDRAGNLRSYATALLFNEIGAQGEIALAKLVGSVAPLTAGTFRSEPDVPPNWNVKTQQSLSKDMLRGDLRLRPRDFHRGYRHVLVEKALALHERFLFVVHGWVPDEEARSIAKQRYANSPNKFVAMKHLRPVERLCDLDEDYWAEVAERHGAL